MKKKDFASMSLGGLAPRIDSTRKNPLRRTLVKLRTGCHNLRVEKVGAAKSLTMKGYVPRPSVVEDEVKLLLDCERYSSKRDIFLSKIETKIDDIRKLSQENLKSQLKNSNDYYHFNLRLTIFISSCFEIKKIDLSLLGILDKCVFYDLYQY